MLFKKGEEVDPSSKVCLGGGHWLYGVSFDGGVSVRNWDSWKKN